MRHDERIKCIAVIGSEFPPKVDTLAIHAVPTNQDAPSVANKPTIWRLPQRHVDLRNIKTDYKSEICNLGSCMICAENWTCITGPHGHDPNRGNGLRPLKKEVLENCIFWVNGNMSSQVTSLIKQLTWAERVAWSCKSELECPSNRQQVKACA